MSTRDRQGSTDLDLLVVGHTNLDRFLEVPSLPTLDRTVPVARVRTELGGTAANLARTAARFGVRTGLVSRVGSDFPKEFRDRLRADRVDLRGLTTVPGQSSPSCYIVEDGSGKQFTLIDQGAMRDGSPARVPVALVRACRWVHLTTGSPPYQLKFLEVARRLGRPVTADPAQEVHYRWPAAELRRLVRGSEILFGNRAEVEAVRRAFHAPRTQDLLREVPLLVETLGPKGSVAHFRSGTLRVPSPAPRRIRHLTGAGDAFRGGFYAAWFAGQPLRNCLLAGTRSARSWIETGPTGSRHGGRGPEAR